MLLGRRGAHQQHPVDQLLAQAVIGEASRSSAVQPPSGAVRKEVTVTAVVVLLRLGQVDQRAAFHQPLRIHRRHLWSEQLPAGGCRPLRCSSRTDMSDKQAAAQPRSDSVYGFRGRAGGRTCQRHCRSFEQHELGWPVGPVGEPGDVQVVELEPALVPHHVVASAEQHEVAQVGGPAVFAVEEVVGVAHGRGAGAAAGDAAEVTVGQDPALRGGDLVGQGFPAR